MLATHPTPLATRSNDAANLSSRSRSKIFGASLSIVAFRSCWVVRSGVGFLQASFEPSDGLQATGRQPGEGQGSSFRPLRGGRRNNNVESLQFCHPSQLNVPSHEWPVRAILREYQCGGELKRIGGSKWVHGQDALGPGANSVEAINLEPVRRQRINPPYGLQSTGVF